LRRKVLIGAGLVFVLCVVVVGTGGFWLSKKLSQRVEGDYFDSNGARIHYTVEGEGEPVVLVHGFAVNADYNWRRPGVVHRLAQDYQVIAFDHRGHGLSDKPEDVDQYGDEMVKDVVRLLDHLGIEKAHVVGYSMGGFITLKLLTMYPDRLLSAAPCAAGWSRPEGEHAILLEELVASLEAGTGIGPLLKQLRPGGREPTSVEIAAANAVFRRFNDEAILAKLVRSFPELVVTEEQLRANQVPVLSIVGDQDPLKDGIDAMTGILGNHEVVVIEGADHMNATRRPEFVDGLRAFLEKHSLAKTAGRPARAACALGGRRFSERVRGRSLSIVDDYEALLRARRKGRRWDAATRAQCVRHRWRAEGADAEGKVEHGLRRGLDNVALQA